MTSTYLTTTVDGALAEHGITEADIRSRHPHTSFPTPLDPADLADLGYLPITQTALPADFDPETHTAELATPVRQPDGSWLQAWVVAPRSPEDLAQRLAARRAGMVVSRAQGEIALHRAGLLAAVEAYMAAPGTDPEARIWWLRSQVFRRTSAVVQAVADALGLSEERVDELFAAAARIDA